MKRLLGFAVVFCLGSILTAYAASTPQSVGRIDEQLLRIWLGQFTHDSMQGRMVGTTGSARATAWLTRALESMGATPMGENGTFAQSVPLDEYRLDLPRAILLRNYATNAATYAESRAVHGGTSRFDQLTTTFAPVISFLPLIDVFGVAPPHAASSSTDGDSLALLDIVYGGRLGDGFPATRSAGRIVAFYPPVDSAGVPEYQLWRMRDELLKHKSAKAIVIGMLELMPRSLFSRLTGPGLELRGPRAEVPRSAPILVVNRLFIDDVAHAKQGGSMAFAYQYRATALPVRAQNLIAMIPGSDAKLRSEYIVLTAHSDHLGIATGTAREAGDSVYHGADEGGSGAVALLAIARQLMAAPIKPKRSTLFVWTVGEEPGLLGAEYYVDHLTVPREQIVAAISVDEIGHRGDDVIDVRGGTSDLGALVDSIAQRAVPSTRIVRHITDPKQCIGDEWHFAQRGIPSIGITRGHGEHFHDVTDDVTSIDFARYARAAQFVTELAEHIGNRAARVREPPNTPSDGPRACVR